MKRVLVLCVVGLTLMSFLTAGGQQDTAVAQQEKVVKLSVLTPFDVNVIGEEYIQSFEMAAEELGLQIDQENINSETYKTRIKIALAGNQLPDIFFTWGDSYTQPFINAQVLEPLNAAVQSSGLDFYPSYVQPYSDGNLYTSPYTANDFYVLLYNKAALKELGVTPPSTWDELLAIVDAASGNPKIAAIGMANGARWQGDLFYNMLVLREDPKAFEKAQRGEISWTSEPFLEAARKVETLVKRSAFQKGFMAAMDTEVNEMFYRGDVALHPIGSWAFAAASERMGDNLGYIMFPKTGADANYTISANCMFGALPNGMMVNKDTKYPEEAARFVVTYSKYVNEAMIKKGRMGFINTDTKPEVPVHPAYDQFMKDASRLTYLQPWWFGVVPAEVGEPMRDLSHEQFGGVITADQFVNRLQHVMNGQ